MKITLTGYAPEQHSYKALTPIPCVTFDGNAFHLAYDSSIQFYTINHGFCSQQDLDEFSKRYGFEFKQNSIFLPIGTVIWLKKRESWYWKGFQFIGYKKYNPVLGAFTADVHPENNIPFELEQIK